MLNFKKSNSLYFCSFFLLLIIFFFIVNYETFRSSHFVNGDFALQAIEVLHAKELQVFVGSTSSKQSFSQPGPILTYWFALFEIIFDLLKIKISESMTYLIASAFLNLFIQTISIYFIFINLKNKYLIIPITFLIFFLLNSVLDNQLYLSSPITISISLFFCLFLIIAQLISDKNFKLLVPVSFLYFTLFHFHVMYAIPSTALILYCAIKIYSNKKNVFDCLMKEKIYFISSLILLFLFFIFPIIYDQFFLTNNISNILQYSSSQKGNDFIDNIKAFYHVPKYLTAFLFSPFYSKQEILSFTSQDKFYSLGVFIFLLSIILFTLLLN